ncbi:prepilin-type N-terminal cleavage/methylation domain-containing protein [Clostridium scatologenes]|uniref:Prepilin-type cleavage/methylation n=1 Tax=Clostridium scatologenes TaxID=1548 RepID=A0A0E3GRF2_CLOSL|nr:prepilin-type N-terminal cleavage/methylation domain-containing protein [Clostridium scatologenes]AKA70216.1 prepilin-type cleavage/methylation [Clostridium scatologenes]
MKNFHKCKGFTLIELMLVITIILILMGFLVPKVSAYQEKARNAKAVNTAKQIETAAMASYGNNDSKFDGSDVTTTVQQLTSAKNVSVSSASDQSINIAYMSDDKNYSVEINANDSTYIVKYGDKQIFPKN